MTYRFWLLLRRALFAVALLAGLTATYSPTVAKTYRRPLPARVTVTSPGVSRYLSRVPTII